MAIQDPNMTAVLGDPVTDGRGDIRYSGGRVHAWLARFTVEVGDTTGTEFPVAKMPREAVILPGSQISSSAAITGSDFGDENFPAGLNGDPWDVHATAGQPLWEALGYASREAAPAQIVLNVTLNADQATADAVSFSDLRYTVD